MTTVPLVNYRAAARNIVGNFNPTINYRALVESSASGSQEAADGRQSSEDDFEKAKKCHDQRNEKLSAFETIKEQVEFSKSHPKWQSEIEDSINCTVIDKVKHISQNLGVLSLLIFIRLWRLQYLSDSDLTVDQK